MSSKIVIAVAATTALLASSVDARNIITGVPTPSWLMDEEEQGVQKVNWDAIRDKVYDPRKTYVDHRPWLVKAAEEEKAANNIIRGVPTPSWLMDEEEQGVQKIANWDLLRDKVYDGRKFDLRDYSPKFLTIADEEEGGFWEVGGGVHGGSGGRVGYNVYGKIGWTFDELDVADQTDLKKYFSQHSLKKCVFPRPRPRTLLQTKTNQLHDEEEGGYWELDGDIRNGQNGGVDWRVGGKIGGTFDEEEVAKLKFDLNKATKTLVNANKMGLFDEDADLDEVQKLKLGNVVKGAVKVVKVGAMVGLLEEEQLEALKKPLHELHSRCRDPREWGFFEEEEELSKFKLNLGKVVKGISTGLDLYGKAKGVGLFEEDQTYGMHPGRRPILTPFLPGRPILTPFLDSKVKK